MTKFDDDLDFDNSNEELARALSLDRAFDPDDLVNAFFFHGKESGPFGSKYQRLKEAFPSLVSPDFQGKDLEERLAIAEEATRGFGLLTLVGSSMGGLVAAMLYSKYPERFKGLVLMAPALHWEQAGEISKMPAPENIRVIHGRQDDVVPLEAVREFCARFGVNVIEVDDCHRLKDSADLMVEMAKYVHSL